MSGTSSTPDQRAERLAATANYLAVSLLHLRRSVTPGERFELNDVREYIPGHFGCVPGLNAIWARLCVASDLAETQFVPIVGTGHGGAAWVAWSLMHAAAVEGILTRSQLDEAIGAFGDELALPHELFGAVPRLAFPSGELGYAIAYAQGVAPNTDLPVVAIVGDGEMETGAALSALAAPRALGRAPLIVVNANGFRMGDSSWWSTLPESGRSLVEGFGWRHVHVHAGGSVRPFIDALTNRQPTVIVYSSVKGEGVPPRGGVAATPVHKVPLKQLEADDLAWLRSWLDKYTATGLTADGLFTDVAAGRWVSVSEAGRSRGRGLPAEDYRALPRVAEPETSAKSAAVQRSGPVRQFVAHVLDQLAGLLITSPDEAASNTVDLHGVEVCELLSEQVTFAWAVASAAAGRASMWATYEAFAPIVTTVLAQYLRHIDSAVNQPAQLPIVVVTSLSTRNVASHQDVAWLADLEHRHLRRVSFVVPPSEEYIPSSARIAAQRAASGSSVPIVLIDKYPTGPIERAREVVRDAVHGWDRYRFGPIGAEIRYVVIAAGAAAFREACRAATLIATNDVRCDVIVMWHWAPDLDSQTVGRVLLEGADRVVAVSSVESRLFNAVAAHARERLVQCSVWRPAGGPNESARLARAGINAYSIAASLSDRDADRFERILGRLDFILAGSRNDDWYSLKPFSVVRDRLEADVTS